MTEDSDPVQTEFTVSLRVGREEIAIRGQIATGPTTMLELLPGLQALTDAVLASVVRQAAEDGQPVSCRAGCGACCRQPVPIAEPEALWLADRVAALPAPRRERVRGRFRQVLNRLAESGLLERLRAADALEGPEARQLFGLEYFRLQCPCPFLEEESCSIHPDRPLACREYLVISPAAGCRDPGPDTIRTLPLPVKPSAVLFRFGDGLGRDRHRWLPLALALEWAEAHRSVSVPAWPGPTLLENFLREVARGGRDDS